MWCRSRYVLGLVIPAFLLKQLLTICHSFVLEPGAVETRVSAAVAVGPFLFSSRWVCLLLSFHLHPGSSFKRFPVRQAKYACHVGTQPWDPHQLLFVLVSPSPVFPPSLAFLKLPVHPHSPPCPVLFMVGTQKRPLALLASPRLCFHFT